MLFGSGLLLSMQVFATDLADKSAAICARLVTDGFEEVRVNCPDSTHIEVALEDNHYHGIYHGLAQALRIIADEAATAEQDIRLIVHEDRMPRLTIHATHDSSRWEIPDIHYGGTLSPTLRRVPASAPSSCKADFVLYPGYSLINDHYDRIWSAHLDINPALEMTFWPGSHLFVQGHIPLWNNYDDHSYYLYNDKPGIEQAVISQQFTTGQHWDVTAAAGLLSCHRAGIDLKGIYHLSNTLDLGLKVGETARWEQYGKDFSIDSKTSLNLLFYASYYEPMSQLQIDVHAGRFLYEDSGARLDVYRHFADYVCGLYGSFTDYGSSFGFALSAPIGPRKMGRHRRMRLRLPETLSYSFDENTNVKNGHESTQIGQQYSVHPEDNSHSSRFWQPEFLRTYILKDLRNQLK